MADASGIIEAARREDASAIRALLAEAALPTADLAESFWERFLVFREGGRLLGAVGLDVDGDAALLRSLVVAPQARQRGLGHRLVAAAEQRAQRHGVDAIYLLTTTAADFFARLDYEHAARTSVPAAIAAMPQFASLCPASSACMVKPAERANKRPAVAGPV